MSAEYRVRWRREGQERISTRIYQGWDSAYRKAQGIAALELVKGETRLSSMPDLVEGPTIEVREVGPWSANEVQPQPPSEYLLERMRVTFPRESTDDYWAVGF